MVRYGLPPGTSDDDGFSTTAPSSAQNSMPGSPSASPAKDSDATPALCVHAQTAEPLQRTLWQRLCALVFASPEAASHESLLASAQAHPITLSASQYTATPMASVTPRIAPQPRLLEQGEATARLRSHLPALDSPLLAPHARPEAPSPLQTPALFGRFPPSHPTSLSGDMVAATAASGSPAHKRRSGGTAPPQYDSPVSHFLVSRRHRHDSDDGAQMTQLLDALPRACSPAPAPPPATRSQLRLTAQRRRAGAGLPCAILAESESSSDGDSSNDDGHVPGMLHGYVPGEADNDKELLMALHRGLGVSASQPAPNDSGRARWQDSAEAKTALARLHSWHAQERVTMDSIRHAHARDDEKRLELFAKAAQKARGHQEKARQQEASAIANAAKDAAAAEAAEAADAEAEAARQADLLCKAEEQAVVSPAAVHTTTLPRPQAGTPAGRAVSAALPKGVRTSKTAFEVAQAELAELEQAQHSDEYLAWTQAQSQLPKSQRARRKIAQALTKEFNQLAGTMASVHARVQQLRATLAQLGDGPARTMFCIGLVQTAKNNAVQMSMDSPRFGFPVAMVLTSMFAEARELPRLFHGTLKSAKEGSPLCVPQYTNADAHGSALDGDAWKRANGYRAESVEEGAQLEDTESFIHQTTGLLRFYGAVLQYYDLPHAWTFVASFANSIPANVVTGTALVAFLETAGYALQRQYGRQFSKMLRALLVQWLPELARDRQAESQAARLAAYCKQGFPDPPEGMHLQTNVVDVDDVLAQRGLGGGGPGGRGWGRGGHAGGRSYRK